MTKFALKGVSALAVMAVCAGVAGQASAADDINLQQAMQYFKYQDGNDRMRVELSPNWSDDLGFSMRGAIGGYLSDDVAIATIVEYGEHKREILGNLGFNLNGDLTIIGTVGNLREELVFDPATGREAVDQMEYGVSLKGHMPILFASEFELNGYLADADSDTDNAIAGKVYGFQYKSIMNLSSATQIKLGAGYEWLEWDDNTGNTDRFTGSIEAYQHLNENFALFGSGFFNTTESRYGGGVDFNLSPGGYNTNKLRLEYKHIDGHRGVQDDDRVMATWSYGFGNGPTRYADAGSMSDSTGTVHAAADLAVPVANNRLLGEVMKRPTFLPERVVAKAGGPVCPVTFYNSYNGVEGDVLVDYGGYQNILILKSDLVDPVTNAGLLLRATLTIDGQVYTSTPSYDTSVYQPGQPSVHVESFDFTVNTDLIGTTVLFEIESLGISCNVTGVGFD